MEIKAELDDKIVIYEVEFDIEKIKEIIKLLDRDCYIIKCGEKFESAYSERESENKITDKKNYNGDKVILDYRTISFEEYDHACYGDPLCLTYEAVYRESIGLVDLLEEVINSKNDNIDYNTKLYDKILNYDQSKDFLQFHKKVELASDEIDKALQNNNYRLLNAVKNYRDIVVKERLNKNFNFKRLSELHMEVLNCLKIKEIEEVKKYTLRKK